MKAKKPNDFGWTVTLIIVAILLVITNFDPVGNFLDKAFGKGYEPWAIIIVFGVFIVYFFIKKK